MTFQVRNNFVGLVTMAGATNAPAGALEVADNVCIRREGVVTPRPGAKDVYVMFSAQNVRAAHRYDGRVLYEDDAGLHNASGDLVLLPSLDGAPGAAPTRIRPDVIPTVVARGRLYAGFSHGVAKLSSPELLSEWEDAGLAVHALTLTVSTAAEAAGILPGDSQYAYRLVGVSADDQGAAVRSRPTGAVIIRGAGGGPYAPRLAIRVRGTSIMTVEVYRTRLFPGTVQVDDEMQLVARIPRMSIPYDFTPYVHVDRVADAQRGATLYTSPSRGGIENANDRPPASHAMATYRGHLFFGNVITPQRVVLSYAFGDRTGSKTGIGTRASAATTNSGWPLITQVATTAGVVPGQELRIVGNPTYVTYVTAVSANTITVQDPPTSTGSVTVVVTDTFRINGTLHPLTSGNALVESLALATPRLGAYTLAPTAGGATTTVVIEALRVDESPFTLSATHGDDFDPPLAGGSLASKQDRLPGALYWSEPDEPEHVPPKNFALVGDKQKAIVALAATRDALWILKEDGVYRLSGVNGNFRIDPYDPTLVCVAALSVRELNGRVYAVTTRGLVAFGDSGVEILSAPIRDEIDKIIRMPLGFADAGQSCIDEAHAEYLLRLPTSSAVSPPRAFGGDVLVYNEQTRAFTTFSFDDQESGSLGLSLTGLGTDASGMPLLLTASGARVLDPYSLDLVDGSAYIGDSVTALDAPGTFLVEPETSARVGDVLATDTLGVARVVEELGEGAVRLDRTDLPASVFVWLRRPVRARIRPFAFTEPPLAGKLWTHVVWALSHAVGELTAEAVFASAVPLAATRQETREPLSLSPRPAVAGVEDPQAGYVLHEGGTLLRAVVPQAHRRGWLLRAGLDLLCSYGAWCLELVGADATEDAPSRVQTHAEEKV